MSHISCEDCKFASWDYTLFRDGNAHYEGMHYVPPYSEQFDLYCAVRKRFFLEDEIPVDCTDGVFGENNYHEVVKEYEKEKGEYLKQLKQIQECDM